MQLSKEDSTALKGIAICLMLLHHLPLDGALFINFSYSITVTAKVCVALFLFLSGYGLTKQYSLFERPFLKNTMQFVLVRYVKFFLPYWFYFFIVVLIGTLCGYTLSDAYPSTRNTLKCFIFDIWGQMGYNSYIKTWWFNKIILQLYLLFPLLFLLLRNKYSIIIGFLIIILLQLLSMKIPGNIFLLTEGGLPAFYLGMSMTKINIKKENIHVNPLISWISVLSTAIILCIVIPKMNQGQNETILLRAFLAVIIVLIYSMAKPKKVKVLSFIGKHATTMYFTHSLFLIIMPQVLTWANNPIITYLTFLSISLLFAIIIRYLQTLVRYNKLQAFIVNRLIHP